jgi:hypothetical protein
VHWERVSPNDLLEVIMMRNRIYRQIISLFVLLIGILTNASLAQSQLAQTPIAKLTNGDYQFCSQPKPNDWRDGAGVCLNFAKVGNRIDGYYGYPHSDVFICIRGGILEDTIAGKALGIAWSGNQPSEIPQNRLDWDVERRLSLGPGRIIRTIRDRDNRTDWILFQTASLEVKGLYQYPTPRMTPASKLCDWSIVNITG